MLLLSNISETFRSTCLEHYALDQAHFYTFPGLACEGCIMKTEVSFELLTDPDMLLMIKHGSQGGITQVIHQHMWVNNKYMGDRFNPRKVSHYIM